MLSNQGSALIQVTIVGALVGALALFTSQNQMNTSQFIKTEMAKNSLTNVMYRVAALLSKEEICNASSLHLLTTSSTTTWSTTGTGITAGGGTTGVDNVGYLLKVGTDYGLNDTFKLTQLDFVISDPTNQYARLDATFTVNTDNGNAVFLGANVITRSITVKYNDYTSSNTVEACWADTYLAISDIISRYCRGLGSIYSVLTNQCFLIGMNPIKCPSGYLVQGLTYDQSGSYADNKMEPVCALPATNIFTSSTCAANQIPIGINADGSLHCISLTMNYISHLVDTSSVNCTSKPMRRLMMSSTSNLIVPECGTNTPTPTAYPTNTPNTTPTYTATPTSNPTATNTPGGPTNTPTPSPTSTPTAGGTGCTGIQGGPFPGTLSAATNVTVDSQGFKYQVSGGDFDVAFSISAFVGTFSFPSMRNTEGSWWGGEGFEAYPGASGLGDLGPTGSAAQDMWIFSRLQIQLGDNAQFANSYLETTPLIDGTSSQFVNGSAYYYVFSGVDFPVSQTEMGTYIQRKNLNVSNVLCSANINELPCYQNGDNKYYADYVPTGSTVTVQSFSPFYLRIKKTGTNVILYQTNAYPSGQWDQIASQTINCVGNYETDYNYIGIRLAAGVLFDRIPGDSQISTNVNTAYMFPTGYRPADGYYDQYPNSSGVRVPVKSLVTSGSYYTVNQIIVNP